MPIFLATAQFDPVVPRLRWAFYAYYPLHLTALWLIRIPMAKAGYLFF
ncbi:MAG: TraX family protein [Devosia sp.]